VSPPQRPLGEDTVDGDDGRAGEDTVDAGGVAVAGSGGELTVESRSVGATLPRAAPALPEDVCAQPATASISAAPVARRLDMVIGRPS
jgi:hypothetical protein